MKWMEISNQNKSIEEILEWYRVTQNSLDKNEELIIYNRNMTIERFIGSSQNEVHAYFRYASNELALMVCFDLLSAVEATLEYSALLEPVNILGRATRYDV